MHNTPSQIFFWLVIPICLAFFLYLAANAWVERNNRRNTNFLDATTQRCLAEEFSTLQALLGSRLRSQLWEPKKTSWVLGNLRIINDDLMFTDATAAPEQPEGNKS